MRQYSLLLVAILAFVTGNAQIGGSNTYAFLDLIGSARLASVGGNQIAINDDDLNIALANPSLLNSEMDNQLALSYVNYLADINYGYAAYARSLDSISTLSASVTFLDYGEFTEADATGLQTGTFSAGDYSLNVGYGRQLDSLFSLGANFKLIYSAYERYSSFGAAFDLSGTYHNEKKRITASFIMRNIGYQLSTYTEDNREPLPFNMSVAATYKLKHAPLRLGLTADNLQTWDLTFNAPNSPNNEIDPLTGEPLEGGGNGFAEKLLRHMTLSTELVFSKNFYAGFGFNYRRHQELKLADKPGLVGTSLGFGLRIKRFHLSYGRASYHRAGASNHFTVTTQLGKS